jgi:hypothetical protein
MTMVKWKERIRERSMIILGARIKEMIMIKW